MTDPIELISYKLAAKVKQWDESITIDVDEIRYGIALKMSYYATLFITIVIGVMSNALIDTMVAIFTIVNLRRFTGGSHMPTLTGCMILSTLLLSYIPHYQLDLTTIILLNMVSLIIVLKYSERRNSRDMIGAITMILTSGILSTSTIALSVFAQSSSLIKGGDINAKENHCTSDRFHN